MSSTEETDSGKIELLRHNVAFIQDTRILGIGLWCPILFFILLIFCPSNDLYGIYFVSQTSKAR